MKAHTIVLTLIVSMCLMFSCRTLNTKIRVGAISELLVKVSDRHDSYTSNPQHLAESQQVRDLVKSSRVSKDTLRVTFEPVAIRHDGWVMSDHALTGYKHRVALRSTDIIRSLYDE